MQRPKENDSDDEFHPDSPSAPNDTGPSAVERSRTAPKRRNPSKGRPNTSSDYEGYETELIKLAALDPLEDISTPVVAADIDNRDSQSGFSSEYDFAAADSDAFRFDDEDAAFDTVAFYDGLEIEIPGHDTWPTDEDEQFLLPYQRYLSTRPDDAHEFVDQPILFDPTSPVPEDLFRAVTEGTDIEQSGWYLERNLSESDPFTGGVADEQSEPWIDVDDPEETPGEFISVEFNSNPDFSFSEQLAEDEHADKIAEMIPDVAPEYSEWDQSAAERRFMGSGGSDPGDADQDSRSSAWDHDKKVLERARILAILRRVALLADDTSNIRDVWFELGEGAAFDESDDTMDSAIPGVPEPVEGVLGTRLGAGATPAFDTQPSDSMQASSRQGTTIVIGQASRLESNLEANPHVSVEYQTPDEAIENPYFDELLEKNDAFFNTMELDSKKLEKATRVSNWLPEDDNIIGASQLHSARQDTHLDGIAIETNQTITASTDQSAASPKRRGLRRILRRAK